MKNRFLRLLLFLFLIFCFMFLGCEEPPPPVVSPVELPGHDGGDILVADFESASLTINEWSGSIATWEESIEPIDLSFEEGAGGKNGTSLKVEISGNTGEEVDGWSGGGLVLSLWDFPEGFDLSEYGILEFSIRFNQDNSLLGTKVKLEDTGGNSRPERDIISYSDVEGVPDEWIICRVPLSEFTNLKVNDPSWWEALDISRVSKLVTISVNDGQQNLCGDGSFYIDDVKFRKENN